MTVRDIRAVSTIRVTGWKAAYSGLVPTSYLDGLSVEADAEWRTKTFAADPLVQNVVAEDDRDVVGWGVLGPCRDDDAENEAGEIYALYVAPARIGTGAGRTLMDALIARAGEAGFATLTLWVIAGNRRARRFYERAGFRFDGTRADWPVEDTSVPEVRYARTVADPR
ncbi:GNAT family N-acetyltransferase [Planotetraspora thailandica]|nr:GNAT family N-acetyltransferase [Planotetraspora thailandica]